MNYSMLFYVLRYIVCCEGLLFILPAITALIYRESAGLVFLACILLCLVLSFPFTLRKPKNTSFQLKEGFITVALCWIVLSIIGGLPFLLSGVVTNPVDALFESVSGFTTTGSSIFTNVEVLPNSILLWRSFTNWIGGMGVLVFVLTVLPMTGGNHMNLMKAESPGPSVEKIAPKVQTTAKILYGIYILMTLLQILILVISKMPVFDAVVASFSTAGTGGFSIKNNCMAGYTDFQQTVITVFMILFGVNFSAYYLLLTKRIKKVFAMSEVITYFAILFVAIAIISVDTFGLFDSAANAVHHAAFQVGSIITTTGFSTVDFNLWPSLSKTVLVILMFIGACAGSTGGGIKVSRIILFFKSICKELYLFVHPSAVRKTTFDKKPVEHEIIRSTNVYMVAYILVFVISIVIVSFDGFDLVTNFTSVTATINNIGPGLEAVGPASNFFALSNLSKLVLTFDMLAGRLELFPMLLLFYPKAWKKF